jgi:hypothetical protein
MATLTSRFRVAPVDEAAKLEFEACPTSSTLSLQLLDASLVVAEVDAAVVVTRFASILKQIQTTDKEEDI